MVPLLIDSNEPVMQPAGLDDPDRSDANSNIPANDDNIAELDESDASEAIAEIDPSAPTSDQRTVARELAKLIQCEPINLNVSRKPRIESTFVL